MKKSIFWGVFLLGNSVLAQPQIMNPIQIDPQKADFAEKSGFEAGRLLSVSITCKDIDANLIKKADQLLESPYRESIYNYPYQKGLKRGYLDKSPNGNCAQAQIAIDSITKSSVKPLDLSMGI